MNRSRPSRSISRPDAAKVGATLCEESRVEHPLLEPLREFVAASTKLGKDARKEEDTAEMKTLTDALAGTQQVHALAGYGRVSEQARPHVEAMEESVNKLVHMYASLGSVLPATSSVQGSGVESGGKKPRHRTQLCTSVDLSFFKQQTASVRSSIECVHERFVSNVTSAVPAQAKQLCSMLDTLQVLASKPHQAPLPPPASFIPSSLCPTPTSPTSRPAADHTPAKNLEAPGRLLDWTSLMMAAGRTPGGDASGADVTPGLTPGGDASGADVTPGIVKRLSHLFSSFMESMLNGELNGHGAPSQLRTLLARTGLGVGTGQAVDSVDKSAVTDMLRLLFEQFLLSGDVAAQLQASTAPGGFADPAPASDDAASLEGTTTKFAGLLVSNNGASVGDLSPTNQLEASKECHSAELAGGAELAEGTSVQHPPGVERRKAEKGPWGISQELKQIREKHAKLLSTVPEAGDLLRDVAAIAERVQQEAEIELVQVKGEAEGVPGETDAEGVPEEREGKEVEVEVTTVTEGHEFLGGFPAPSVTHSMDLQSRASPLGGSRRSVGKRMRPMDAEEAHSTLVAHPIFLSTENFMQSVDIGRHAVVPLSTVGEADDAEAGGLDAETDALKESLAAAIEAEELSRHEKEALETQKQLLELKVQDSIIAALEAEEQSRLEKEALQAQKQSLEAQVRDLMAMNAAQAKQLNASAAMKLRLVNVFNQAHDLGEVGCMSPAPPGFGCRRSTESVMSDFSLPLDSARGVRRSLNPPWGDFAGSQDHPEATAEAVQGDEMEASPTNLSEFADEADAAVQTPRAEQEPPAAAAEQPAVREAETSPAVSAAPTTATAASPTQLGASPTTSTAASPTQSDACPTLTNASPTRSDASPSLGTRSPSLGPNGSQTETSPAVSTAPTTATAALPIRSDASPSLETRSPSLGPNGSQTETTPVVSTAPTTAAFPIRSDASTSLGTRSTSLGPNSSPAKQLPSFLGCPSPRGSIDCTVSASVDLGKELSSPTGPPSQMSPGPASPRLPGNAAAAAAGMFAPLALVLLGFGHAPLALVFLGLRLHLVGPLAFVLLSPGFRLFAPLALAFLDCEC
eukprot:gene3965-14046_t